MKDKIEQKLNNGWPGDWGERYSRDLDYGVSACVEFIFPDDTCQVSLYIGSRWVWKSGRINIECGARALRARAEILVDALRGIEELEDTTESDQ